MSKKPLSSRKTRCAPSRAVFFYMRPAVAPPMRNRGFVALTCTPLGFLATPAHRPQEPPNRVGMVADTKLAPNYCGDPLQGPQLCPISCHSCALEQDRGKRVLLGLGQIRRTTRYGLGAQALRPVLLISLYPAPDRTLCRVYFPRGCCQGLASFPELDGAASASLQIDCCCLGSHVPKHNYMRDVVPFFMRNSRT